MIVGQPASNQKRADQRRCQQNDSDGEK